MRWQGLFDDLEAQADALAHAERAAEVETRTRGEVARITVPDRLRAARGTALRLRLAAGPDAAGMLSRVGPDWLLIDEGEGRETLVVLAAVVTVRGLTRSAAVPGSVPVVESRLGLRHALRGLARDRSAVRVQVGAPGGGGAQGLVLDGTIDRVGADHVELAAHAPGEWRRRAAVREVELVPLAALVAVRRLG